MRNLLVECGRCHRDITPVGGPKAGDEWWKWPCYYCIRDDIEKREREWNRNYNHLLNLLAASDDNVGAWKETAQAAINVGAQYREDIREARAWAIYWRKMAEKYSGAPVTTQTLVNLAADVVKALGHTPTPLVKCIHCGQWACDESAGWHSHHFKWCAFCGGVVLAVGNGKFGCERCKS